MTLQKFTGAFLVAVGLTATGSGFWRFGITLFVRILFLVYAEAPSDD